LSTIQTICSVGDRPCQPDWHGRYPGLLDGGADLTAQPDIDLLHRVDKRVDVRGDLMAEQCIDFAHMADRIERCGKSLS
jgi:hypothetical protein